MFSPESTLRGRPGRFGPVTVAGALLAADVDADATAAEVVSSTEVVEETAVEVSSVEEFEAEVSSTTTSFETVSVVFIIYILSVFSWFVVIHDC